MFGRYILEQPFARGAQAHVFCAEDKLTGRKCLIKFGDSVRKEAFLARELNHPYISKPFDFGVDNDRGNYAAYELLTYPTLTVWMKARPVNDLRKPALQIAEFLAYLHHRGWLYNDFKPDHFLVGEDGVNVIDLGLCSRLDPASQSTTYDGTFPFIAPERMIGRGSDQRSDIFAFGMMLLQLFFPREHWTSEPSLRVLQQLQRGVLRLILEKTAFGDDRVGGFAKNRFSSRSLEEVIAAICAQKFFIFSGQRICSIV
jgi:serine/threonine protein kinase